MMAIVGNGGPSATGWAAGNNGKGTTCYKIPAYLTQSGDTITSIIQAFYGDVSPNGCIVNALISFNPIGSANCAVLDCSGDLAVNKWVALPTTLFDGSTTYSFACGDAWVTDPEASGLLGFPGQCNENCAGFATVSDTCGAGTVSC